MHRAATNASSHPLRLTSVLLVLALLAAMLSACVDEEPVATPRPTRTPRPAARPTSAPARPTSVAGAAAQADWTVLVYLDGDNDLEDSAIDDFNEMASVGSTERVNIIVQLDRIASSEDWDDDTFGDWEGVKRFRIEQRKRPVKGNQLADLGELNMGDPQTVVDFVTWGMQRYPARQYALIFWDHGAAWPGIASDDTSDGDMLTLPELSGALAQIQQNTGVQKLDLIGFDACLMSQIDVLRAVAPYGDVAIGSADLEPGEGWAWNAWLADLTRKPAQDAAALAPSIIKSFTAFYKKEDDSSVTLAAFDLSKVDLLTSQLDTLAGAMIKNMPASFAAIGEARAYAAEYASGDADISAIDLGYFAESLISEGADSEVTRAARALSKTIKEARIVQGYGADHPNTSGISVYFPQKKKDYDTSYVDSSPLTEHTRWDEFLQSFYKAGRSHSSRSTVSKPRLTRSIAAPSAPTTLEATISGDDTTYVSYFVAGLDPSDPNTLEILALDYIYPPGTTASDAIPSWSDGDTVKLTWKASSWYLSSGSQVIASPLLPVDYGSSSYSVDGTYTYRTSGKQIPVSIEFTVAQGRGTLEHIWAFDKGESENPRPRELKPRAGDTFTPDLLGYTASGDDFAEQTRAGQPITFGEAPLLAFESDAPAGDYVIGLLVENTAGDLSDHYTDVSVERPDGDTLPEPPEAPVAPQQGDTAGMLAFADERLGFQIDYPRDWEPFSSGADKVVFAHPELADGAALGVDVYALEGTLTEASRAIMDELLAADSQASGFALREEPRTMRLAGHNALRVEYVYEDRDGTLFHVIGVAVSDKETSATYLLTFDAPEASFASDAALFEQMLKSFAIQ